MDSNLVGRCGLYCDDCEHRESSGCKGCGGQAGKMFWGDCPIFACADAKGLLHCGQCEVFPCDGLNNFAFDPQHGDKGRRIRIIREWNDQGVDVWVEKHIQQKKDDKAKGQKK